jgi:hypothetical protein
MSDSNFCFAHNPETIDLHHAAATLGGMAPKPRKDAESFDPVKLQNIEDLLPIIEDTINKLRTRPMTYQKANAISSLCGQFRSTIESINDNKKLKALEDAITLRKKNRQAC